MRSEKNIFFLQMSQAEKIQKVGYFSIMALLSFLVLSGGVTAVTQSHK